MTRWKRFESKKSNKTDNLKKFRFEEFCTIHGYFKIFKQHPKYQNTWFLIIETDDDEKYIINTPTHLKNQLLELTNNTLLCEGDKILIKYVEDKNIGKPKPMKVFEVYTAQKEE